MRKELDKTFHPEHYDVLYDVFFKAVGLDKNYVTRFEIVFEGQRVPLVRCEFYPSKELDGLLNAAPVLEEYVLIKKDSENTVSEAV
jgi:hypothetical protein